MLYATLLTFPACIKKKKKNQSILRQCQHWHIFRDPHTVVVWADVYQACSAISARGGARDDFPMLDDSDDKKFFLQMLSSCLLTQSLTFSSLTKPCLSVNLELTLTAYICSAQRVDICPGTAKSGTLM